MQELNKDQVILSKDEYNALIKENKELKQDKEDIGASLKAISDTLNGAPEIDAKEYMKNWAKKD